MNKLFATVSGIESSKSLSLVYFDFEGSELFMAALDMSQKFVVGEKVVLGIKSTAVALSKATNSNTTVANSLAVEVDKITHAKLLSSVIVKTKESSLEAIVPKQTLKRTGIKEGDLVFAFFLASELFIIGSKSV